MHASSESVVRHMARLRGLLAVALLWAGPTLACGSFAPRPTPTPTAAPETPGVAVPIVTPATPDVATPLAQLPPDTPTPDTTATFTPTPVPGTVLAPGQPARVTAPAGLNFRESPSAGAALIGQFGTGQRVTVLSGPIVADGFTWWQIDDGAGNSGWAAEGDESTVWLSPQLGEPQPANRTPRVGDRVVVTGGQLSVRAVPGTDGTLLTRANPGAQFTVLAGPQAADGFNWFQIRSDDAGVEGWAADGDGAARWLSPLE